MSELGRTGQVAKAVDEREARVLGDRRDRRPPVDTRTNTPVFASGRANARLRRLGEHTVQIGYEPELFLRLGERGRLGGSAVLVVHSEFDYRLSCPNRCVIVCSMVSAARAGLGGSRRHPDRHHHITPRHRHHRRDAATRAPDATRSAPRTSPADALSRSRHH